MIKRASNICLIAISGTNKNKQHETGHCRKTERSNSSISNTASTMTAEAVAAITSRSRKPHQLKKVAHNAIERRYRNNINDRIGELKNVVPALYKAKIRGRKGDRKSSEEDDDSPDEEEEQENNNGEYEVVEGVVVANKLNKATILHKATEYIYHLKHTNEIAKRENQVLQQILAQMPGGSKVLARFQAQKNDFQQLEQQRLIAERKEAMEREKNERQHLLRERAAQRAALAEVTPKPERKPYRRRAQKQQETSPYAFKEQPATSSEPSPPASPGSR
jgi:hypothetical protein